MVSARKTSEDFFDSDEIEFGVDSGLILDLRAGPPPEDGGNGSRILDGRPDFSGAGNNFDRVDGAGPIWLKEGLNGHPTLLFEGDTTLSMQKRLIGDYEPYSIIVLARYTGEKRGRVVSSADQNWLFGFHDGCIKSWFTGQWLEGGERDDSKSWKLQSAVVNMDGNNLLRSWADGEEVFSREVDIGSGYRSIGRMSVGGWRNASEQTSECEIARILVFDRALGAQELRHYEFLLKKHYSLDGFTDSEYLEWVIEVSETDDLIPMISKEAARIALSLEKDEKILKKLIGGGKYSESEYHQLMSKILRKKRGNDSLIHQFIGFFLDPTNPKVLSELITNFSAQDWKDPLGVIYLIELMCITGNEGGLDDALSLLGPETFSPSQKDLFAHYEENLDYLERGRYSEFFEATNRFLLENGSECSRMVEQRLSELANNPEIRSKVVERLNGNSDSDRIIRFSTEYFKFEKRRNVGGFADRIKGATTIMLLSIALGRRFEIEWKYPFEIGEIFTQIDYDWRIKNSELDMERVVLIDSYFTDEYREIFGRRNIEEEMEIGEDSVEAYCNLYFDESIMNDKIVNLIEDVDLSGISQPDLVGTMLSLIGYRPNLIESVILQYFLSFLEMFEDSIAIHFRTGGDGDWNDPVVDSPENVHKIFSEAMRIMQISGKKTCVYFATDSKKLKSEILERYGREMNIFSINIPIAHIDRSTGSTQISGSRFSIMENYMISLCRHVLAGKGAFSVLAANRRFEWPWRYFKNH